MKAVIQRVKKANVEINGKIVGEIDKGIVILVGFEKSDVEKIDEKIKYIAEKIVNLRIFEDKEGKMNLSIKDVEGSLLVVSNFTIAASVKKGRRPSFDNALSGDKARVFYERFVDFLKRLNIKVETGEFQAYMKVNLINDGPVTFIVEK
ncbi:D-tyrosyl-tRNA(Tyr) deacylase [Thermotomaculum hydrothermale]|uniref:D-aminoacyl-tRNA deacylase n=1 Tax=Thermotomaculum hydrothermale TaxID=981385 RepID=A0A7R6SYE0_9BACT|nr:D-aminoacyl-tRNA deacylase [Thermotomaculum hydrothermale]BBB32461.1 D-tyrosyl-tRNA(Tyr) deacylase [Thermotomaculum hydrothermale]